MQSFRNLKVMSVCLAVFAVFPSWIEAQQSTGQQPKQTELIASLRPVPGLRAQGQQMPALRWQRVSPPAGSLEGPVLYTIIMRSNATAGNLPKISPTYTLTNSLVSENNGIVSIGGTTSVAAFTMATGAGAGKVFTSDNSGNASWQSPLGVSITAGAGLTATPSPITGTGTIAIANAGVGNAQLASNAVLSGNIAGGQVVKNLNGLFDGITLAAGSNVTITPSGQTLTIAAAGSNESITPGNGLTATPNPITGAGTIGIADGGVGAQQLAAGAVQAANIAGNAVQSGNIAPGQVVKALNGLFDGVTLAAGSNVSITPSGQTLTIAATVPTVSITAGTGLTATPSPITGTGTVNIANGGVGNAQLASNAVQAGNIATGQVVKNLNGLFDGVTLAAGSNVTIIPNGQTLTIASGATSFVRTVVVSPVPGNAVASGTALLNALAGITTASAANPWLLKIEPGIYDLGSGALSMKPFVDVEGSGEDVTTITAAGNSSILTGTVVGANNAELRFLTVKNTGGNTFAVGIASVSASPRLTHVTVTATGGSVENFAVYNNASSPVMKDVTATASGTVTDEAVVNVIGSTSVMTDVIATATGGSSQNVGVLNSSSAVTMTNVTATATASGSATNSGVENLAASPTMINVTASASGGSNNIGVNNQNSGVGSSPVMTNVTANTTGVPGSNNRAVYNTPLCHPPMTNLNATASGPAVNNTAVENDDVVPVMNNIAATASGATSNFAMVNLASGTLVNSVLSSAQGTNNYGLQIISFGSSITLNVSNSVISASTNSILNQLSSGGTSAVRVGSSQLGSGPVSTTTGATYTCVGAYNSNFAALNASCQ